jgi:hypothetical protein
MTPTNKNTALEAITQSMRAILIAHSIASAPELRSTRA